MNDLNVRIATINDLDRIVTIHVIAFPGFFLTFLGPQFLKQLYKSIIDDKSGVFLVCEASSQVAGFVAGVDQPKGFYLRLLKKKWWRFAMAAFLPAMRNPSIIRRLLRAFSKHNEISTLACASLMSIAVDPQMQGKGVGKALVDRFIQEVASRNLSYIQLTTDARDNESANRFYQNLGFLCTRTFTTPEGRAMNEYLLELT